MTTTLYRAYDDTGQLLYVGIAIDWRQRLGAHQVHSEWFTRATTVELEHHPTRQAARLAEQRAIRRESPIANLVHRPIHGPPSPRQQAIIAAYRQRIND